MERVPSGATITFMKILNVVGMRSGLMPKGSRFVRKFASPQESGCVFFPGRDYAVPSTWPNESRISYPIGLKL